MMIPLNDYGLPAIAAPAPFIVPKRGTKKRLRYFTGIAAPSSGSRQNERRAAFGRAFRGLSKEFAGEPRSVRRRMARGMAKHAWLKRRALDDLKAAQAALETKITAHA